MSEEKNVVKKAQATERRPGLGGSAVLGSSGVSGASVFCSPCNNPKYTITTNLLKHTSTGGEHVSSAEKLNTTNQA